MQVFPDPANSPAQHTRVLGIQNFELISPDVYPWIRPFCRLEELIIGAFGWGDPKDVSLAGLHRLSPTLKTLRLNTTNTPISEILDLTCSFPLLEDLVLRSELPHDNASGWTVPSTNPKFTGSLRLSGESRSIARALLDLPHGLHFSKIWIACFIEDVDSGMMTELVSKCSDTLESLSIRYIPSRKFPSVPPVIHHLTVARIRMPSHGHDATSG